MAQFGLLEFTIMLVPESAKIPPASTKCCEVHGSSNGDPSLAATLWGARTVPRGIVSDNFGAAVPLMEGVVAQPC